MSAHQKHVARVVSKKYLIGLKANAISTLAKMSLLHPKIECDLHEEVLPWLMEQKDVFSKDANEAEDMATELIESGIMQRKLAHAKTLKERQDKLKKAVDDVQMAGVRQQQRRVERKLARETRAKDEAKAKMRDEIRRLLIEKGQCVNPCTQTELIEIHGCFEKGK